MQSPSEQASQTSPRDLPELVPVRMVNEYVYCPRLLYLEWAQGEWADNWFTEDGKVVHRRVDREAGSVPAPEVEEPPPFVARSVAASSARLGLSTKLDVIEGIDGAVTPIDYKRGKPPKIPHRVNDPERVQLCAQALVLRDSGYRVEQGEIYFAGSRERVAVPLDAELIRMTEEAIRGAREVVQRPTPPPPLLDSPKCNGCSLVGICLPDETNSLAHAGASEEREPTAVRRLYPARDDKVPLYVQRGGTKLGVEGDVLVVKEKDKKVAEARLEHTSQVSIYGGAQVSTQALRRLLDRDIPLAIFSAGGWFSGWARGLGSRNVDLRRAQFKAAEDPERALVLARRFVSAKLANQRTILRRHRSSEGNVLDRMTRLREDAQRAGSVAELLGLEGTGARLYFERFPSLLKADMGPFQIEGRNRRPPLDPVNALLSFVYALLAKDWTITCALVGFDPYLGFYHRPRFGRASLALDLLEEFRPIVGDSIVLSVVNNREIGPEDFVRRGTAVALKDHARRRLINAYERRMDELVTHPLFSYRLSYRRVFEVQARLLGRFLLGEIDAYPEFRTR